MHVELYQWDRSGALGLGGRVMWKQILERFEVFTAVTMKNAVIWDVAPCRYGVNGRFGGTYRLHLQDRRKNKKIRKRRDGENRCKQTNVGNKLSYMRAL
jgi:hypothetical protein